MDLNPKAAGFAPKRLDRIADHLSRNYVDNGKIAGAQVAVTRKGHLAYFKSLGQMDRERAKPMADDTIFRIYSMSKPITSVALMTLYERGYFQLNDPVSRFFPAWKDQQVWVSGRGADMKTEAPTRPVSMRDMLCHTGGLTYGSALPALTVSVVSETGGTNLPGVDPTGGWELEESLDVEWAHALAPSASITLVEASSTGFSDVRSIFSDISSDSGLHLIVVLAVL